MGEPRDLSFDGRSGTLLGPLTTAWAMPDSCTVGLLPCATCSQAFLGQHCVVADGTGGPSDYTGCWPPATAGVTSPDSPFVGWGFYSPGLACPTGYTTACTAKYGARPGWDIEFSLISGETAIGCCPTGYQCTNMNGNTCVAYASSGATLTIPTGQCSGSQLVSTTLATFPDIITVTTTTSATTGATGTAAAAASVTQVVTRDMILLAPMFQLNHQPSDLPSTGTTSSSASSSGSSSGSSSSGTETSLATSNGSSSSSSSSSTTAAAAASQSTGLSTGAVVGVAIGAALGGILLAALVALVWIKRRRQRAANEAVALASIDRPWDNKPGGPYYAGQAPPPVYYEMGQPARRYEMDGSQFHSPVEMPSAGTHDSSGYSQGGRFT